MKKNSFLILSALALASVILTSCDTPSGQGAGLGATAGAILGAATTGTMRGAMTGAALGAVTGAIIGAQIEEDLAERYGPRPPGGFPFGRKTETRGFIESPYPPYQVYDLRGVPHGGLVEDRVGGGYFRKP